MNVPTPSKSSLSPRRRRLRWTIAILSSLCVVGILAGVYLWRVGRPQQYRPDEISPDITSSLSRNLPPDAPPPRFADATVEAGVADFKTFKGERTAQLPEDMGCGAAWGDFDNDGYEDLFLVSGGGPLNAPVEGLARSALYRNRGDGTFQAVAEFPDLRIHGMGAAWGDYDSDGYLDLAVTGFNFLALFHNEKGTGKFVIDSRLPNRPGFWSSASWGDYDNDRNLDLYVCGYVDFVINEADRGRISAQIGTAVPFTLNPSSYEAVPNLLFHNDGNGTFTEVAEKLGVHNPKGRSLGGLWHDFDEDGWLDLYVANDISDNAFYRNKGGRFEDLSYSACVADYRSAMGLAAGDWARKGYDDLFVSHWIGQQYALFHNLWADLRPTNTPAADKFKLTFMDLADIKGLGQISLAYIGWGTEFFDYDNDGWLDLAVVNGSTLEILGSQPKKLKPQEPFLFWNQRAEHFHNVAPLCKPLTERHVGRGLAVADYNRDGALDMVLTHLGEGAQLLRNELHSGNWIEVRLRSRTSQGAPIGFGDGTKVIAHLGNDRMRRTVSSVSYLSQNSRILHFGLGKVTRLDQMEVRWHAGETNFYANLEGNALWEIIEGVESPKLVAHATPPSASVRAAQEPAVSNGSARMDRATSVRFWNAQRAAMNALKIEKNPSKAVVLFREALALNPHHEDSRYYLGQCLAALGDFEGGLQQFEKLAQINPQSHRAFQQWGVLRAASAKSDEDLAAAEKSLEKAHALNPEETGSLLVLGEVALLSGSTKKAEERLTAACVTNPRAAGGFFLRGYLAWERGETNRAIELLTETRQALGKEWVPKGTTSEGDVQQKQFADGTPLTAYWENWDGRANPERAFTPLRALLVKTKGWQGANR